MVFEYKARALPTLPSSQHDWLSLDGKNSDLVTFLGTERKKVYMWKKKKRELAERGRDGC